MNCKNCGSPLRPEDKFCINCGFIVGAELPNNNDDQKNTDGIEENDFSKSSNIQIDVDSGESSPSTNNENKSGGKLKYFAIILLALAIIIASVVFGFFILEKDDSQTNKENKVEKIIEKEILYKTFHNGYNYFINEGLLYENTESGLVFGNEQYKVVLETSEGSFALIKNNRSLIQSEFEGKKYSASVAETRVVDEVEFITIEVSKDGINGVISYSKIDEDHYLVATIYSINNEFIYEPLDEVSKIIKRIQKNTDLRNLPAINVFKTIGAINVGTSLQRSMDLVENSNTDE